MWFLWIEFARTFLRRLARILKEGLGLRGSSEPSRWPLAPAAVRVVSADTTAAPRGGRRREQPPPPPPREEAAGVNNRRRLRPERKQKPCFQRKTRKPPDGTPAAASDN